MATVSGMFNPAALEQRGISVSNKTTPADTTLYMRAQQAATAQAAPPTDNAAFSKISGKNVPVSTELLAAQEETSGRRIAVSSVKRLDATLTPMRIAELPEKEYQGALEALERMFEGISLSSENLIWPDDSYLANHPATKEYATVKVGNTVVATLDNQGTMSTSNATYEKLKGRVPDDVNGKSGPILAQARAEKIAALLGGTITKSSTAITQAAFDANPIDHEKLRPQVNEEAMKQHPLYAQIQSLKAERAAYLAAREQAAA